MNPKGALFSNCRKYRYLLWRIWNPDKPLLAVIGLNPSTANEHKNDQTINKLTKITYHNKFGGFYMMNLFAYVTSDPDCLFKAYYPIQERSTVRNDITLKQVGAKCKVVYAWGNFKIPDDRDKAVREMLPNGYCFGKNNNGSPKHPLFLKSTTEIIQF